MWAWTKNCTSICLDPSPAPWVGPCSKRRGRSSKKKVTAILPTNSSQRTYLEYFSKDAVTNYQKLGDCQFWRPGPWIKGWTEPRSLWHSIGENLSDFFHLPCLLWLEATSLKSLCSSHCLLLVSVSSLLFFSKHCLTLFPYLYLEPH